MFFFDCPGGKSISKSWEQSKQTDYQTLITLVVTQEVKYEILER